MRPGPVLVIQTAFLGDVVLTTSLLTRLAARYGPVDVVTTPAAAELLETHPAVRHVIPYDKRGADRGLGGFRRLAERLTEHAVRRRVPPAPLLAVGGPGVVLAHPGPDRVRRQPGGGALHRAGATPSRRPRERPDPGARRW